MGRRKIAGALIGILLLCIQVPLFVSANPDKEELSLYASSAVLLDAASGRVLYGKNADTPMAMASTTKIMTCITILESTDLEEELQASAYAASMPKVKLYLKKGEAYRVKDLLYSLMLESHNDSAAALAEHVGKNYVEELRGKAAADFTAEESKRAISAFAALMNRKAAELGCENTYFITPNGLDATETITLENGESVQKEHCTTAAELAKIFAYCIGKSPKSEAFLEITRTPAYGFAAGGRSFSCVNHNAFLNMMPGALSGKTGFTNKAGYCYVGALQDDDRTFVVALLACGWPNHKTYKWSDTKELMQYGLKQYFFHEFSEEEIAFDESSLKPLPVSGGRCAVLGEQKYMPIAVEKDAEGLEGLLLREDEQIQVKCRLKKNLEAPVASGVKVGEIIYAVGDTIYRTDTVITTQSVEKIDFSWCFLQIWARFMQNT